MPLRRRDAARTTSALVLLTAMALLLGSVRPASAAVDFTTARLASCGNERGSGQADSLGRTYVPCLMLNGVQRPNIRVFDPHGVLVQTIVVPTMPTGDTRIGDVAPSPDGSVLYVAQTQTKLFRRLLRQGDGSYALDTYWAPAKFSMWGSNAAVYDPKGEFLQTDAKGDLFLSSGTWAPGAQVTVVKYDPLGRFVTRFGQQTVPTRDVGSFYWMLAGITASSDGTEVYTVEVGNNRIQRWTLGFDGNYSVTQLLGNTAADDVADDPATPQDESRVGFCADPGKFAAPYDAGVDAAGALYVINTTCSLNGHTNVQRYANGAWQLLQGPTYTGEMQHGIAVAPDGTVYVPSSDTIFRPTGVIQPTPDMVAPVITAAALPATIASRETTLVVQATDAVGVTQMRTAEGGADIALAPWLGYDADLPITVSAGDGDKVVAVQVRDAAGNVSAVARASTRLITAVPAPDVTAPVLVEAALPATIAARDTSMSVQATDAVGVTQVRTAEGGAAIAAAPWTAFAANLPITVSAGDGVKVVAVQVRDAAGNVSAVRTASTTLTTPAVPRVNTAPVLRDVLLPDPATAQRIDVAVDAVDDVAVAKIRLATDEGTWGPWQDFAASVPFDLRAGLGLRGVFVQVRDAAGLESGIIYRTTTRTDAPPVAPGPDVSAPTLRSVTLPATITSRTARVTIDAVDDRGVAGMRFAADGENLAAAPWRDLVTVFDLTLPDGAGTKTLTVQVRDSAGNASVAVVARTTYAPPPVPAPVPGPAPAPVPVPVVDAKAPVLSQVTLPAVTSTRAISVAIVASDDVGIAKVRLANEDGAWSPWRDYSPNVAWTLTPRALIKGVSVQVRDAAGHESGSLFRTTLCAPCLDAPALAGRQLAHAVPAADVPRVRRATMRADRLHGSAGAEHFDVSQADHRRDVIDCGSGFDTVLKRPEDVTMHCELVRIVRPLHS